jgi:hypothetical protein
VDPDPADPGSEPFGPAAQRVALEAPATALLAQAGTRLSTLLGQEPIVLIRLGERIPTYDAVIWRSISQRCRQVEGRSVLDPVEGFMKTVILLCAVILAAGCASAGRPGASTQAQSQAAKDKGKLAEALSGRIAGPPQDCVNERDLGGHQSFGEGVILFSGNTSSVVYVNRPPAGCLGLNFRPALKIQTTTTQLCRGDIVTLFDPATGQGYGGCALGEFTPYRRTH